MANASRVAIIGGGWAGLSAAIHLTLSGIPITLFEAGKRLGGRARTVEIGDHALDNGQHLLLGAYQGTLHLMRTVGVEPDTVLERIPLHFSDNTGFTIAQPNLPSWMPTDVVRLATLLSASPASIADKLGCIYWLSKLRLKHFSLPTDTTVSQWLEHAKVAPHLRHHLWEPLCLAALNTPAERASAQTFAHVLQDSLASPQRHATDFLLPRVPLGQILPEPAQRWLEHQQADIRLRHRVRTLTNGHVDGEPFAAVIVATAPQHAGALLQDHTAQDWGYEPIATLYLQYSPDAQLPSPVFSHLKEPCAWFVDRGQGLIAGIISGRGHWTSRTHADLLEQAHAQLGFTTPPLWGKVIQEQRATFSCTPHLVRPSPTTPQPACWRAGDYTWARYPATLEGAVLSGQRAAHLAHQFLQGEHP